MRISHVTRRVAAASTLALALFAAAPAARTADEPPAASPDRCEASLPLVWIDEAGTDPAVIAIAEREAADIWAAAGLALAWARIGPARPARADDVFVIVRRAITLPADGTARLGRRHVLGRVVRSTPDNPGRLIEVALPKILASIAHEPLFHRRPAELPPRVVEHARGRALGRVVAHEVGHWLFGRGHAASGLMKASIARPDLVAAHSPPLPADWPARTRGRLRAHRPCPS